MVGKTYTNDKKYLQQSGWCAVLCGYLRSVQNEWCVQMDSLIVADALYEGDAAAVAMTSAVRVRFLCYCSFYHNLCC